MKFVITKTKINMGVASASDSSLGEGDEDIVEVLTKRVILKVMKTVRILVITIVEDNQQLVDQRKYKAIG